MASTAAAASAPTFHAYVLNESRAIFMGRTKVDWMKTLFAKFAHAITGCWETFFSLSRHTSILFLSFDVFLPGFLIEIASAIGNLLRMRMTVMKKTINNCNQTNNFVESHLEHMSEKIEVPRSIRRCIEREVTWALWSVFASSFGHDKNRILCTNEWCFGVQ